MARYVKARLRIRSPLVRSQVITFTETLKVEDDEYTLEVISRWQHAVIKMDFEELGEVTDD